MAQPNPYQLVVERACSTEPGTEESRQAACDDVINAINGGKLGLLDLAVLLASPLTSPEKEAREHGTRLLGEVVARSRAVLGEGELHTLAEFLSARLKDWPCVGVAAAACCALLRLAPPGVAPSPAGSAPSPSPQSGAALRDESALMVLQSAVEMLRAAQSFRQEERCALLRLLLAAARGWGRLAASRGVELLDGFLGAADGEKDPRCLLLAFEAAKALCEMYHDPRVDPATLRQLSDEVADWASSYFPISFNPPPSLARGPGAITREHLAAALEAAMAASPFLADGVLPLLVEKLSSTYRPAKEAALSALRRCCPAYGPDALAPHIGLLWPALRSEVLAPCGRGPGAGAEAADSPASLAREAAGVLTVAVRASGPGAMDALALQDPSLGDLLSVVRAAGSPTRGSTAQTLARAERQVLCGSMLLAAVCAAGLTSLQRASAGDGPLAELRRLLAESLTGAGAYDKYEQTLYGMTVLTVIADAVATELTASSSPWLGRDGGAALAEVKVALTAALNAVHRHLNPPTGDGNGDGGDRGRYSSPAASELLLAVVAAWRALLRLHQAAVAAIPATGGGAPAPAAAAGLRGLMLTGAEVAAAAEQLCACAIQADPESPPHACRMQWGEITDVPHEAAAALQLLLQLQPASTTAALQPSADGVSADTAGIAAAPPNVVELLMGRLMAAMAPAARGEAATGGRRVALRLATELAQIPPNSSAAAAATAISTNAAATAAASAAAASGVDERAAGPLAFATALLNSLPPLLLRLEGAAGDDEEWLKDCLYQLSRRVLPLLAPPPPPPRSGAQPPSVAPPATAAAAHRFASAALAAAGERDAAAPSGSGSPGLPFGCCSLGSPTLWSPSSRGASAAPPASLMAAWCAAVQHLVSCCDDRQQLDLAMEAAERIAACGSPLAFLPARGDGIDATTTTAAITVTSYGSPVPRLSLPLACAAVAGLRPNVLGAQSTQALVDSLLRLLMIATSPLAGTGPGAGGVHGDADAATRRMHMDRQGGLRTAAVALAAAVNRWPDAGPLDAWLAASFRPALLARIAPATGGGGGGASASVTAVQAVGWVGRALALRNHTALEEVVEALLGCTTADGPANAAETAPSGDAAAAIAATSVMEVDGPTDLDAGLEPEGPHGHKTVVALQSEAALATLAAAEALGLVVADVAAAGGVELAARPSQALCRVLWQQRAYSLCAQALDARCRDRGARAPLPLPLAMAVAAVVEAAPRSVCRHDIARLGPLLLRAALALCSQLGGRGPGGETLPQVPRSQPSSGTASAAVEAGAAGPEDLGGEAVAAAAAAALRGSLAVVLDWLQHQKVQPSAQMEKVLVDHAAELVDCACTAAGIGTTTCAWRPGSPQQQQDQQRPHLLLGTAVQGATAVPVREEALRCCTALIDAVPYHVLHPLRHQVLGCILLALDDNKRSVRQLAVRARRIWGDK